MANTSKELNFTHLSAQLNKVCTDIGFDLIWSGWTQNCTRFSGVCRVLCWEKDLKRVHTAVGKFKQFPLCKECSVSVTLRLWSSAIPMATCWPYPIKVRSPILLVTVTEGGLPMVTRLAWRYDWRSPLGMYSVTRQGKPEIERGR